MASRHRLFTLSSPPVLVAAALSAAVTSTNSQETASTSQAEPTMQKYTRQTPAALREKGSGEEGKDSHSRQWRLSMAVFLNRNKRPQAAPIEVAELLSEKPPPPQFRPPPMSLGEGARGRGLLFREAPSLAYLLHFSSVHPLHTLTQPLARLRRSSSGIVTRTALLSLPQAG